MIEATLAVLGWVAAALAALLALSIATRSAPSSADRLLAGLLAVIAAAAASITASHAAIPGAVERWLDLADVALTFASGPLLAAWVDARTSPSGLAPRWLLVAELPAIATGIAGVVLRLAGGAERPLWALAAAIGYQIAFTGVAIVLYRRRRDDPYASGLVASVLAGMVLVHLAQGLRGQLPGSWRDLVPAALTLLLFALAFVALRDSTGLLTRRPPLGLSPEAADSVVSGLERLLRDERIHLRPDLTLAAVATRLKVSPTTLSRAVNRHLGRRFGDLLAERRVEEAKRLLRDPALAHLSVEAIGQRAGFASRSTFFDTFRRLAASTPAEFRSNAPR